MLEAGRPAPITVVIGLSDGKNIEITKGNLVQGDQVIVAQYRGAPRRAAGRVSANGSAAQPSASPAEGEAAPRPGTAPGVTAKASAGQ
jgi:hypothetical protein